MGHDAPGPGKSADQAMFSLEDHFTGRFFSSLTPCPPGPRNWTQSPARAADETATRINPAPVRRPGTAQHPMIRRDFTRQSHRMSGSTESRWTDDDLSLSKVPHANHRRLMSQPNHDQPPRTPI